MTRYGSVVSLSALALTACDVSTALEYAVRAEADVLASASTFEARFFAGTDCAELELAPGRLDLALTSTPSLRADATSATGFTPADLSTFDQDLALDLRAKAGDGSLLARRCVPVASTTEAAIIGLSRFAPAGATATVVDGVALVAGASSRPAEVRVTDAAGEPVERVFASLGPDRPLLASDANGLLRIRSSTVTVAPGETRTLAVHGIVGARATVVAEGLAVAACPESTWSRDIVPGLAGAQVAIAAADAGPRTLIALLRPTTAASMENTLEILAADEGASALRSLTTATTAAAGWVAIAADRATGAAVVLAIAEGTAELRTFDPVTGTLGPARRAPLGLLAGGRTRGVRASWLSPGGARFAVWGDVPRGAIELDAASVLGPLLPGADRTIQDVLYTDDGVLAASAAGVERFARVGGALVAQTTPLTEASGRLLDLGRGRVVVLDGTTLEATDAEGPVDRVAVAEGTLALAAGDLNGDATADLLLLGTAGPRVVLVSRGGRLLPADVCPAAGGPRQLLQLPLDRGGRSRWVSILDQTGRIALWVQP